MSNLSNIHLSDYQRVQLLAYILKPPYPITKHSLYYSVSQLGVLHDYIAQRSDEISLEAGEKVKLLFKDTGALTSHLFFKFLKK